MVSHKNVVSTGFDMLTLSQSVAPQKVQGRDEKESFRSMMDKHVKNAKEEQPKAEQKEEQPEVTEEMPKQEQEGVQVEAQELAAQIVAQFAVFPEQERATLNWGEAPQEMMVQTDVSVKAAEAGIPEQTVGLQSTEQVTDNPKLHQVSLEGQSVKTDQAAVQKVQTTVKSAQEQPTEAKEQQGVKQELELTEDKAVVQQDTLQQQDVPTADVETETDTTEGMAFAPKEAAPKETELVQVKVGDKVNITSANAAEELADTVLVKVEENMNEYELQLAPEELGKIKVKLVLQDGKISVAMSCENQKAADLLAATGGRLKAVIEERTGSEVFVQVQQEEVYQEQERQGQSNGRGQEQHNQKHQETTSPEELADFMQQLRLGLLNLT